MSAATEPLTRRKRAQCRRAGVASGRTRRKLALKRRGFTPGPGTRGLALDFELRQLSRAEFDRRYEALWARPERPTAAASWERGREALWKHLMGVWRLLSVRGQHARTTNGQRAVALSSWGLPRSRRTLQRYSRKLEAMQVAGFTHVRKPQGQLDCLSVEWRVTRRVRILHVTPPSGTVNYRLRRGSSPPYGRGVAPPPAADDEPPDEPAERLVTLEEEIAAKIRFQQLKLDIGFGDPARPRAVIAQLKLELAELSGQDRARTASPISRGLR